MYSLVIVYFCYGMTSPCGSGVSQTYNTIKVCRDAGGEVSKIRLPAASLLGHGPEIIEKIGWYCARDGHHQQFLTPIEHLPDDE